MKLLPADYRIRQRRLMRLSKKRTDRKRPRTTKIKFKDKLLSIAAPKEISLASRGSHHNLTLFLRTIRKEAVRQKRVHIDFTLTNKLNSSGMLLMLAELDRLTRALQRKCRITCSYPEDETVEKVFQQVGFFNIFGKPCRLEVTEEDRNVFYWRYATGVSVNPAAADSMLKGVRSQIPVGYQRIVAGVEEAMDNSIHHAYLRERGDRLSLKYASADEHRWWVFAEVLDGWLHVIFCDLGLGIPVTLPSRWEEHVKDIVSLTSLSEGKRDVRMIRRALNFGRTRTAQSHRGKGLQNIARAAQELGGKLNVYSNMGLIGIDYQGGTSRYVQAAFKRSILGTVIQWSVPITDRQDVDEHEHG